MASEDGVAGLVHPHVIAHMLGAASTVSRRHLSMIYVPTIESEPKRIDIGP